MHEVSELATPLTAAEEEAYGVQAHNGDAEAQRRLVEANLRLVVHICKHYVRETIPLADLVAAGNEGLVHASRAFKPHFGVPFHTYASIWIRKYIFGHLDRCLYPTVPVSSRPAVRRVDKAYKRLQGQLGRRPTVTEVAAAAEVDESEAATALQLLAPTIELDAPVDPESADVVGTYVGESHGDADARETHVLERIDLQRALRAALATLPAREIQVVVWAWGLDTGRPLDNQEIATRLGITAERVRQLKTDLLATLAENPGLQQCWR